MPVAHRHVVFTIPKILRGPFEREGSLLGLLARAAYETARRVLKAAGEGKDAAPTDAVPGFVASIQTFGSYANFHPHVHALVTEGVFARDGTFHAVAWPPSGVLEEALRRFLLVALERAERLTEEFAANLASWRHSGFSVYAASQVAALDFDGLEPCPPVGRRSRTTSAQAAAARERRTARYVTQPALATGAVTIREDGRVDVAPPPDPRTGATSRTLAALDFVRAVVTQIPDARKHLVRHDGAYSHRRCGAVRAKNGAADAVALAGTPAAPAAPEPVTPAEPGSPEAKRCSACFRPAEGRRVLKKVFEVDPLVCPTCRGEMKVIAWITDRAVIDRILAHRAKAGLASPFEVRGPPASE